MMRLFYPEKLRAFVKKYYGEAEDFPEFVREDIDVFITAFRYSFPFASFILPESLRKNVSPPLKSKLQCEAWAKVSPKKK